MKRARALSLIEVVLALVVVGLAAPTVLISIAAGVQQQQAALIEQNLVELAGERIGEVLTAHVDPTRGYAAILPSAFPDETAPGGLTGYERRTEIREVSPTDYVTEQANSGIKRIRVTVRGPRDLSLTVETFVTDILE